MATDLRNIRVPVNVADVVISQAGKEIYQMLQRYMMTQLHMRRQKQ